MLEFVLADRITGSEIGPLEQATQRTTTPKPLSRLGTAAGRVRRDDPLAPAVMLADKTLVKVYDGDDGALLFTGPITSVEKTVQGGGDEIAFTATAGAWLLDFRKIPASRTTVGYSHGTATVQVELVAMAEAILAAINAERGSQIVAGSITYGTAVGYIGPWFDKFGLEAIMEICARLDGPDWQCVPVEPAAGSFPAIAAIRLAPAIGQDRPEGVWEYGAGRKNVKSWRQAINPAGLCNWGRNVPSGWPTSTEPVVEQKDAAAIADRGQFEATIASDLAVPSMRQAIVDENVRIRKQPQNLISIDPAREVIGALEYGVDYAEGDAIRFHAQERFPVRSSTTGAVTGEAIVDTVDAAFRLRAVTFSDDDQGATTKTFQIAEG